MIHLVKYIPKTQENLRHLTFGLTCGGSFATRAAATTLSCIVDLSYLHKATKEGLKTRLDHLSESSKKIAAIIIPMIIRIAAIWGAIHLTLGGGLPFLLRTAISETICMALALNDDCGHGVLSKAAKKIDTFIRNTL